MQPESGSQDANALWPGQPHHPEGAVAPPHTHKASQWRRVSPPPLGGEREGKSQPSLPSPQLGTGVFQGPGLLEFGLSTGFNPFSPRLAIFHPTCLHRSRCIRVGGTSDRSLLHQGLLSGSLLHRGLLGGGLLWRSGSHPNTRPTGAYPWAFGLPVRLLLRQTWLQLRPPGQWCPSQMGALMDLASFDQQPMEVAPSFNPEGELREAV